MNRRALALATVLAFLAGAVDAVGFLHLGGLFVSFMTGNSTRLGVFLTAGDVSKAAQVTGIIAAFVVGAGLGTVLAIEAGRWRQPVILVTEAALLAIGAGAVDHGFEIVGIGLVAGAMGLENATFLDAHGTTTINLTFMTGALVRLGQGLAAACFGRTSAPWMQNLLLWLGLTAGATAGALGYERVGFGALYVVSCVLAGMAAALWAVVRARPAI